MVLLVGPPRSLRWLIKWGGKKHPNAIRKPLLHCRRSKFAGGLGSVVAVSMYSKQVFEVLFFSIGASFCAPRGNRKLHSVALTLCAVVTLWPWLGDPPAFAAHCQALPWFARDQEGWLWALNVHFYSFSACVFNWHLHPVLSRVCIKFNSFLNPNPNFCFWLSFPLFLYQLIGFKVLMAGIDISDPTVKKKNNWKIAHGSAKYSVIALICVG